MVYAFCPDSCLSQRAFFQAARVQSYEFPDERGFLPVMIYIVRYLVQDIASRAEEHPVEPDVDNAFFIIYREYARGVVCDDK